jgi:hypothetical protein
MNERPPLRYIYFLAIETGLIGLAAALVAWFPR